MDILKTSGLRIQLSQCLTLYIWSNDKSANTVVLAKDEIVDSYGQKVLRKQILHLTEGEFANFRRSEELLDSFFQYQNKIQHNGEENKDHCTSLEANITNTAETEKNTT